MIDEKEKTQPVIGSSPLFEPYTFWVMLALLVLAIWFSFWPLLLVSLFLMLLFGLITGWKKFALKYVQPTLSLKGNRIFAGDSFQWTATLQNRKLLPLVWIEWTFSNQMGLHLSKENPGLRTLRFLWVLWHGEASWTENGKAVKRGVYDLGDIKLVSGDGFRFAETSMKWHLPGIVYVYPKIQSVINPKLQLPRQMSAEGKKGGFFEDPLLLRGIRPYCAGDELRRINWKTSARTGTLQTNLYQPVVSEKLFFYVDVAGFFSEPAAINEYEEAEKRRDLLIEFEEYLSIIASLAMQYHHGNTRLGFISNALDYEGRTMGIITPCSDFVPFMDALAKITEKTDSGRNVTLNRLLQPPAVKNPLLFCCREMTNKHYEWILKHQRQFPEIRIYYQQASRYSELLTHLSHSMNSVLRTLKG